MSFLALSELWLPGPTFHSSLQALFLTPSYLAHQVHSLGLDHIIFLIDRFSKLLIPFSPLSYLHNRLRWIVPTSALVLRSTFHTSQKDQTEAELAGGSHPPS